MDIIKVDPFDNVVDGGLMTAKYQPDLPSSLFGIVLTFGLLHQTSVNLAASHFSAITVKAGGKELVPGITGARLNSLNLYDGVVNDSSFLSIFFGDPTANSLRGKHLANFDTTIYGSDITIQLQHTAGSGGFTGTVEAHALIMPPKLLMGVGYSRDQAETHRALIETIMQPSAAITRKAFSMALGSEAGAAIRKLAFFHTNLTAVQIKKSGVDLYDDISVALADYLADDVFARAAQSGLYVYDRLITGDVSEAMSTVDQNGKAFNIQTRITTSASDTITAYADVMTKLNRL